MQRAFHAFPYGASGLALAGFRLCVAAQLALETGPGAWHSPWLLSGVVLVAAALVLGLLTPLAALLCLPLRLAAGTMPGADEALLFACAYALVLAVLGPGAYSLDARLYGRRVIAVTAGNDVDNDSDTPPSSP